jgi:hypothetical protein
MRQVILLYFYSFIAPLLIMSFEDAVVSIWRKGRQMHVVTRLGNAGKIDTPCLVMCSKIDTPRVSM